jgi:hypothetical protein
MRRCFPHSWQYLLSLYLTLAGCTNAAEERQQAGQNLKSFDHQPVEKLIARLGPPDNVTAQGSGKVYMWTASRDISEVVYTQGMMGANGKPVEYNPDSPALMKHELCILETRIDPDNLIVSSVFHGNHTGACVTTFEKLKDPDRRPMYPVFP